MVRRWLAWSVLGACTGFAWGTAAGADAEERRAAVGRPPGRRASGPLDVAPPVRPAAPQRTRQLSSPVLDEGVEIQNPFRVETPADRVTEVQAPGTFTLRRSTSLSPPPGYSSTVNEPNVGTQGQAVFMTWNWYAGVSTNNGVTFSYVNPYTTFPTAPLAFSGGFCCDQRVAQDPSRDLVFWYLQYVKSESALTNGARIAVARGAAALATNTWSYHDFSPADFGFASGHWLDFPHLQVSANYLYFTSNVFTVVGDQFAGAVAARIPLDALANDTGYTMDTFVVLGAYGSIALTSGATDTMYLGSVSASNSIKVLRWPESSPSPTVHDVVGLATTSGSTYTCVGPDGLDSCTRANPRMQTGWITASELGFMWTSSQDATHPYPYVRVVLLNPALLGQPSAVLAQPDIFSTTHAWLYPMVAVNARGHIGGVVDALGGSLYPTVRALIRDDLSADVTTFGWETYQVSTSTHGTAGRWGDYNGTVAHEAYPNTWLGAGHTQEGGSLNANSVPRNFWFMRERDSPSAQTATVAFSAATSAVEEGAASATPYVVLTTSDGLPLAASAGVAYSTSDGTARSGSDYDAVSDGLITFAAGMPSGIAASAPVSVLNDAQIEGPETFSITLSGAAGATLGEQVSHLVTITDDDVSRTSTIGVWRPTERAWYLRNSNSSGFNDVPAILYGADGDIPVVGDWNGDGIDTIGVYRPSTHVWYLRNSNTSGFNDVPAILYGADGDVPVVGDWDGDGVDTIGVYRPSTHVWYLRNSNTGGFNDVPAILYGTDGDVPVVGDWNGDGTTTVGVYRPAEHVWYLRDFNSTGGNTIPAVLYGTDGDVPVVGDWNGDGFDAIGIYRPAGYAWHQGDGNTAGSNAAPAILYGASMDRPVTGNWDGS